MEVSAQLLGAIVLCFIYCKDSKAECLSGNENVTKNETFKSGNSFYTTCCSEDKKTHLKWINSITKEVIGPDTSSNVYTEDSDDGTNLFIENIRRAEAPYQFTCVAENGAKKNTLNYIINAYDPPVIFNTSDIQTVIKDDDSIVRCQVGSIDDVFIGTNWFRERMEEIEIVDSDKYEIINSVGLKIKNVNDEDGGIYRCRATHYVGGDVTEKDITVEVVTRPTIDSMIATPANVLAVGDALKIECIAQGIPHPKYSLRKLGNESENNIVFQQVFNTLIIENVIPEDRGQYECVASNEGGTASSQISIEVLEPATVQTFENITALEGSTAQMTCNAHGRPAPHIDIWTAQEGLNSDWIIINTENSTETEAIIHLTFKSIKRHHDGTYFCYVSNSVSNDTKSAHLTVLHQPYLRGPKIEELWGWNGKTVNFSCENESNPKATIVWRFLGNNTITDNPQVIPEVEANLMNFTDYATMTIVDEAYYGYYECTVTNDYGTSTKTYHLKQAHIPGNIQNATINETKSTSVTFDIIGPAESMITGYTAEYDEVENYNITNIHNNRTWSIDRQFKIDKLKPNTTFKIRFAAKNDLGDGEWCDFIEFQTEESTTPDPPELSTIIDSNSLELRSLKESDARTLVLKWNEPDNNGDPIDHYVIRYCEIAIKDEIVFDTDFMLEGDKAWSCREEKTLVNEITLVNLHPNTTYNLEVIAHNSLGNSSVTKSTATTSALLINYEQPQTLLSAGAIIAVSVITVFICLLILDVLLLVWQRKGIIASCCRKRNKKDNCSSRDNKGLLKDNTETNDDSLKRPDNRQKPPEIKHTGVITGKHSAV